MMKLTLTFLIATAAYSAPFDPVLEIPIDPALSSTFLNSNTFEQAPLQTPFTGEPFSIPEPKMKPDVKKSPILAATMSSFIPGLGHTYLGDYKTAGAIFGTAALTMTAAYAPGTPVEFQTTNFLIQQNTTFYGVYAAYRDARNINGQSTYAYKMPTDSLGDLTSAPFSWKVLKKPEVWGGLIGMYAFVATVVSLTSESDPSAYVKLSSGYGISPIAAFPVGIGEEAFYRGYIQSVLCEWMPPAASIALSSILFGAAHIPNAMLMPEEDRMNYYKVNVPMISSLGLYFGWLTHKNRSLKESVALHAWYDFFIFAAQTAANKATSASIKTPTTFGYSTSF